MRQYLDFLRHIRDTGAPKASRGYVKTSGAPAETLSVFGYQMRFDLAEGFPLVTTKKIALEAVIHELLWFLRGDTNVAYLKERNVKIWDEWADANGDLGPVYGKQWRAWPARDGGTIDQIANVVREIAENPDSRRLVVSAWNPDDVPRMKLPPCHTLFQFYVSRGRLSCQLYQRSGDAFLGVPFNIASYALLTSMVAHVTGLEPGEFVHSFGDAHLYTNALPQVETQLAREPLPLPKLELDPAVRDLFAFERHHIKVVGYQHHDALRADVVV